MRLIIVSLNVGKLSANSRASGFFRWALENNADVICIQSTGVHDAGYPQYANLAGFRRFSDHHQTNGTTGVAIYTRANAGREDINICDHEQCRGRHIEVRLPSGLIIGSTYIRSGADWARQEWKQNLRCVAERMRVCADEPMIVTGDFNLAIEPIDLWPENPKSQRASMALWCQSGNYFRNSKESTAGSIASGICIRRPGPTHAGRMKNRSLGKGGDSTTSG